MLIFSSTHNTKGKIYLKEEDKPFALEISLAPHTVHFDQWKQNAFYP